jgi:Flp pilus assembly protein CpaB
VDLHLAGRGGRRFASLRSRRSRRRLLVSTLLAVVAGGLAASAVARAEHAAQGYGEVVEVPVVVRLVPAGSVVAGDDVERRPLPRALVPGGVAEEAVGRVAADALRPGEVVLEARLGGSGSGPAALLQPGERALVVPIDERSPALSVGDHIDVLAPDDSAAPSSPARRVARSARVIAVGDVQVTIALPLADLGGVARAVLDGAVALALVGPAP